VPHIDLPELLLEVAGWTGFLTEFTHVSEGAARADDLDVSICAVLLAEACNIGLEPVTRPSMPALTRARLSVTWNLPGAPTATAIARMRSESTCVASSTPWLPRSR